MNAHYDVEIRMRPQAEAAIAALQSLEGHLSDRRLPRTLRRSLARALEATADAIACQEFLFEPLKYTIVGPIDVTVSFDPAPVSTACGRRS